MKSSESSFQKGWEEAMGGEIVPIDQLWTGIEEE